VKVISDGGQIMRSTPEFDDCRRLAQEKGLPLQDVYRLVAKETATE
jgi:uncharacterized protein (DUF111 family)